MMMPMLFCWRRLRPSPKKSNERDSPARCASPNFRDCLEAKTAAALSIIPTLRVFAVVRPWRRWPRLTPVFKAWNLLLRSPVFAVWISPRLARACAAWTCTNQVQACGQLRQSERIDTARTCLRNTRASDAMTALPPLVLLWTRAQYRFQTPTPLLGVTWSPLLLSPRRPVVLLLSHQGLCRPGSTTTVNTLHSRVAVKTTIPQRKIHHLFCSFDKNNKHFTFFRSREKRLFVSLLPSTTALVVRREML